MKKDKEKKKKNLKKTEIKIDESLTNRTTKTKELSEESIDTLLSLVGGKWKLKILFVLCKKESKTMRYGEFKIHIKNITDMMLSKSLKELTESKLIERMQYQEIPPKVEYQSSAWANKLIPVIESLCSWANQSENK